MVVCLGADAELVSKGTSSYALADWRGPGPGKCGNSSYHAMRRVAAYYELVALLGTSWPIETGTGD